MTSDAYSAARTQLHTIAEWLMAGPQHAASGTIRLRAGDDALATVAAPAVRVTAAGLTFDGVTHPLTGTVAQLAVAAGLPCRRPDVAYHDAAPGAPDTVLDADPTAVAQVLAAFDAGAHALADFSAEPAVVWPEHFDLAIRVADVNYGVSPGDSFSDRPYAYVGPDEPGSGEFWNAPFGAYLTFEPGAANAAGRILTFFESGRDLAAT